MTVLKPGIYQHYKGHLYELVGIAHHSENLEELVVYRGLYEDKKFGKNPIWVRPISLFTDEVMVNGQKVPRFRFVKEA